MQTRVANILFLLLALTSYPHPAWAAPVPNGDPKAVALASQSLTAITSGANINDVTLAGTVEWSGTDSGSGVLKGLGTEESSVDLTLSSGTRTEIRDTQTGSARGEWLSDGQNPKLMAARSCATDPVWFFPALSSLGGRPNRLLKYVGKETRKGVTVEHLRSYAFNSKLSQAVASKYEALTAVDFYLDVHTLLPVALSFSVHPDDGGNIDLPTVIEFANYQNVNGVLVPMRIRKYMQGNLSFDFTVTNVALNTGLQNAQFALQSAQTGK